MSIGNFIQRFARKFVQIAIFLKFSPPRNVGGEAKKKEVGVTPDRIFYQRISIHLEPQMKQPQPWHLSSANTS